MRQERVMRSLLAKICTRAQFLYITYFKWFCKDMYESSCPHTGIIYASKLTFAMCDSRGTGILYAGCSLRNADDLTRLEIKCLQLLGHRRDSVP